MWINLALLAVLDYQQYIGLGRNAGRVVNNFGQD
jgi:hypothetical protein